MAHLEVVASAAAHQLEDRRVIVSEKFIIFNTEFLISTAQFIICKAQFIIIFTTKSMVVENLEYVALRESLLGHHRHLLEHTLSALLFILNTIAVIRKCVFFENSLLLS